MQSSIQTITRLTLIGLGVVACSSLSSVAQAQAGGLPGPNPVYTFTLGNPIFVNGSGNANGFAAGIFRSTLTDKNGKVVARDSVCNDIAQHIAPPYSYPATSVRYFATAGATQLLVTDPLMSVQRQVAFLLDHYLVASKATTKRSATFQQVIWNLWNNRPIYTGSGTQYDAAWRNTLFSAIVGKENYVSNTAIWVKNTSFQDQLMTGDPIPEPAFYQMSALLLMGGVGVWRMRRKRK